MRMKKVKEMAKMTSCPKTMMQAQDETWDNLYFEGLSGGVWLSSSRGDSSSDGVVQGGRISFSEKEAGDINGA